MKWINKIKCKFGYHNFIIENHGITNIYTCKNCGYIFGILTMPYTED